MKKAGLIVASLMLAGTVAMAAGPVYSRNTVGYQTLDVAQGLNMIGANWNLVGGSDQIPIDDLLDKSSLLAGDDAGSSDNIYVWDPAANGGLGGYKQYYLWNGDNEWYDPSNDSAPTTDTLSRGQGFWLLHKSAATNTVIVGEVPTDGTNSVTFSVGLTQFGSAFTADIEINGANNVWAGNAGDDAGSSDNVYVWDTSLNAGQGGYRQYYLWNGDNEWYDPTNDSAPTTDVIPMGRGAWYKNIGPGSVTWSEIRPY